jgi:SAM-dependent methyltransferase
MVDWVVKYVSPESKPAVLEIGSGNGALLFALVEGGYDPDSIVGIDYSPDAVRLARLVGAGRGCKAVRFEVCDFLREDLPFASRSGEGWDLLLDKGTFDAIALGETEADGRSPAARYPERVVRLLKDGGFFLITCACVCLSS